MKHYTIIALLLATIGISTLGVFTTRSLSTSLYLKVPETPLLSTEDTFEPGKDCVSCHYLPHWTWNGSKHREISCDTCHGKMGAHLKVPRRETVRQDVPKEVCINCHGAQQVLPVWWSDFLENPEVYLKKIHTEDWKTMFRGDIERHVLTLLKENIPIEVEFFVNLHCPSTGELLKSLIPWLKHMGRVEIKLYHIAYEVGFEDKELFFNSQPHPNEFSDLSALGLRSPGREHEELPPGQGSCSGAFEEYAGGVFQSRFGREELEQAIDWSVIQASFSDGWLNFLQCAVQDIRHGDMYECLDAAAISSNDLYSQRSVYGEQIFFENMSKAYERRVRVSPTVFINGMRFEYPVNAATIFQTLCSVNPSPLCEDYPYQCGTDFDCRHLEAFARCQFSEGSSTCLTKQEKPIGIEVVLPAEDFLSQPTRALRRLHRQGFSARAVYTEVNEETIERLRGFPEAFRRFPMFIIKTFRDNQPVENMPSESLETFVKTPAGYLYVPPPAEQPWLIVREKRENDIAIFVDLQHGKDVSRAAFILDAVEQKYGLSLNWRIYPTSRAGEATAEILGLLYLESLDPRLLRTALREGDIGELPKPLPDDGRLQALFEERLADANTMGASTAGSLLIENQVFLDVSRLNMLPEYYARKGFVTRRSSDYFNEQ